MGTHHYQAFGLAIDSELPLPGGMDMSVDDVRHAYPADLEISESCAALAGPFAQCGPYRYSHNALWFEQPNTARYLCLDGKRILVEPSNDADMFNVSASLIATAIPASLWMRGEVVMHAAAVVMPGNDLAIACSGVSGSGKSTVLSQLVAMGAQVIADDSLCARVAEDSVQVSGLAASYFLGGSAAGVRGRRALCAVPKTQQLAAAELAAFVVLDMPRAADSFAFHRLRGTGALEALLKNRHRPRVPGLLRTGRIVFEKLARLYQNIPVYSWSRQEGAPALGTGELTALKGLAGPRRHL